MTYWYTVVLNLSNKLTYISNYDQQQLRTARLLNFRPRIYIHSYYSTVFFEKLTVDQAYKSAPAFFFQNPKVYYSFHMSLSARFILNHINPANAFTKYFPNAILISTTHVHLDLQTDHFPLDFPTKNVHIIPTSPISDTFPAPFNLLDVIKPTVFYRKYVLLNSFYEVFVTSLRLVTGSLGPRYSAQ